MIKNNLMMKKLNQNNLFLHEENLQKKEFPLEMLFHLKLIFILKNFYSKTHKNKY